MSSLPAADESSQASRAFQPCQCYHCQLPVKDSRFQLELDGKTVYFCCPGCQSVTQMISGLGLKDYYAFRDAAGEKVDEILPDKRQLILDYNQPAVADRYLREITLASGQIGQQVDLAIDGISCAACVWLIEKDLSRLPGVLSCKVNLSNHQARVCFDPSVVGLGDILLNLHQLGYQAAPRTDSDQTLQFKLENRKHLRRLVVSGLGMMQVMMFAVALYTGVFDGMENEYRDFLRGVSFLVSTAVLGFAGLPFIKSGWRGVIARAPGMDLPVSIAILAAYFASIYSTLTAGREVYFDSLCMFIFFLSASRYLEFRARFRANETNQHFAAVVPATASCQINGEWQARPIEQIEVGQLVRVRRGETVPLDGEMVRGRSEFDESLLTGESRPVPKRAGDTVFAGSVNRGNPLEFTVTSIASASRLSAIMRLMEDAQLHKPRFVELSQWVASWFVVVLIVLAVVTFAIWSHFDADNALWITLSVLIVTCPCALSLAMPTVLTRAINVLGRRSILLVNQNLLSGFDTLSDFVFDKTGTLTTGSFSLSRIEVQSERETEINADEAKAIAAALERHSEHPLARAFDDIPLDTEMTVTDLVNDAHRGVEGRIRGRRYRMGRCDFVTELAGQSRTLRGGQDQETERSGDVARTAVFLGDENGLLARFTLHDQLRPGVIELVHKLAQLKTRGRRARVHIVSGDSQSAVAAVAGQLGVETFVADQSPEDKLEYVRQLQADGARVLFVGDGINDSPVLSLADCGLAMGSATDLARVSADGVLMSDQLQDILSIGDIAGQSRRIIRQNIIWAIGYNLSTVPLAMLGYVPPYLAALGMSASSLLVTFNALRVRLKSEG